MRMLVLGASGFIGSRLVRALASRFPQAEILASDVRPPATPGHAPSLPNVSFISGNILDPDLLALLFRRPVDTVFHLAAALTMDAESDFGRGMDINVQALIRLLDACRLQEKAPRFLFASSISTFGGKLPSVVNDHVHQNPQTSYGTHKLIGEQLVNDYSRRGFLDGRSLRLPIVLTHPGPPSASVSDRVAALIREPLAGRTVSCPIAPDTPLAVISVDKVIAAMLTLLDVPPVAFAHTRALNMPALTVTPRQIAEALMRRLPAPASDAQAWIAWEQDAAIQSVVDGWPSCFTSTRAIALGLEPDASVDDIIDAYLASAAG